MNILFTTPSYGPHIGGAQSCIEDLAREFIQKGHRVTLVTSRSPHSLPACENRDGTEILRLNYPPQTIHTVRDVLLLLSRCVSLLWQLYRIINSREIEIVCVGLVGIDSFFVLLLRYITRFRLIIYLHGGELRSYVNISRLIRWTLRQCLNHCHAAIAVSGRLKDETLRFAPAVKDKLWVIPNGVDFKASQHWIRYKYPRAYILYVGRLHPVKSIDTLIRAFRQVSESISDLDLLMAGIGPEENRLKEMVAEYNLGTRVLFLGSQQRQEVFSLLKGCEFLILPSQAEGCPVTILEAIAAGKMTIGSRVKGISEVIEPDRNGVLFAAGDADELGQLILKYHVNKAERLSIEAHIKNSTWKKYDITQQAQEHLSIYRGFKPSLTICLISAFYYHNEQCTGLASYYYNLSQSLAEAGHHLYLITLEPNGHLNKARHVTVVKIKQEDFLPQGDTTVRLRNLKRLMARLMFSWKAYVKVKELDRTVSLDVVVAPELFAQGLFVGLLMRKKLVTRLHAPTSIVDRYNQRYRYNVVGAMLSLPEKIQAKLSQGLTLASEHLASAVSQEWGLQKEKLKIIPNGVQIQWVRTTAAQQEQCIEGEYVLYFGRLERLKGVLVISQALPGILQNRPNINMVFIGKDGGLKHEILRDNAEYRQHILFFDTMERERLFGVIQHARLIVLPSLFENFSNAGLEAMALGKPVIGTYGTGFEELIEDGENGFLVKPGDPQALSAKVTACLERKDLERIGQNAYKSILRFDAAKVAADQVAFYRDIISRR